MSAVTLSSGVILSGLSAYDANASNVPSGTILPGDQVGFSLTVAASNPAAAFYDEITAIVYGPGLVVLPITFAAQSVAVGLPVLSNGESYTVELTSAGVVPADLAAQQVTVVVGSASDLGGYTPGTTFSYEAPVLAATLAVAGSVYGPPVPTPPSSVPVPTPTGAPSLYWVAASIGPSVVQAGGHVTVNLTVGNHGASGAAAAIAGTDTLGRTWGPAVTGTVAPGATADLAMTSGATPASAAGRTVTITLAIQSYPAAGEVTLTFTVAGAASTTTTPPPGSPPSWWDSLSSGEQAAVIGGGAVGLGLLVGGIVALASR